jgi:hypothetical protein
MLTKEQMEEAWRTGPIGFLKNHNTKTKSQKLFKIKVTPYKTTNIEEHVKVYEIWSKNQADAVWNAKSTWYKEHYDVNQTGLNVSIVS